MAATYKLLKDLIDRLEMKADAGLITPDFLQRVQQNLEATHALDDHAASLEYRYAHELQALICLEQENDKEAQKHLSMALAEAGSIKKIFSRTLKQYAKKQSITASAPRVSESLSNAQSVDTLSARDQKFLRKYGLSNLPDMQFFTRESKQYLILTLVTLGLYQAYWSYRNWQIIREHTNQKIRPVWRTIFTIFYMWPLFRIIVLQSRLRGFEKRYSGGWLTLAYLVPGMLISIFVSVPWIIWLGTSVVTCLYECGIMILVQNIANYNNTHITHPLKGYASQGKYEKTFTIVAIIVMAITMTNLYVQSERNGGHVGRSIMFSLQVNNAKIRLESAQARYERCVNDLRQRRQSVDVNDVKAVKAFNNDVSACVDIQSQALDAAHQYDDLRRK